MKNKKMPIAEIRRQDALVMHIKGIIQKEAFDAFKTSNDREDAISKRLSSLERTGMPQNELEFIKKSISEIKYMQSQQKRALEEFLKFFNITKSFFEENVNPQQ